MMFSSPTYVYLQVSRKCAACALECYAPPDGASLSQKEAFSLVDLLWEAKVFTVLIDGGEPLLWEGIAELVEYMRRKPMVVGLVSGAEDISQAEALRNANLNMIQFPIEGPEEYHDSIRGEGSFQRTLEAMKTFCDLDIDTHVGTVVTPQNLSYLEATSDIVSRYPVNAHRILRYIHPTDYLGPDQCMDLLSRVYDLKKKGRNIIPNNCYTFLHLTPYKERINKNAFQGCVGGKTSAMITCDGYVVPCPHFASKPLAESIDAPVIWDSDLKTIWKEWDFLNAFRNGLEGCQSCSYCSLCGGCRAAAYRITQSLDLDPGCPLSKK